MSFHFGKSFVYNFYPLTTDDLGYELLDSTAPSIYLFDSYPTEDEAVNGTGALQTVLTWSDTDDSLGKKISFDAVSEPSDLSDNTKKYYIAINAELEAGETISPTIKEIVLQKLRAQESIIDVTVEDLLRVDKSIPLYCKDLSDLQDYIDLAVLDIKLAMVGCNIEFSDIQNPGGLTHAAIRLAISKFYFGQYREPGDKLYTEGARYYEQYKELLSHVKLSIDRDGDGRPEGIKKGSSGIRSFRILR